MRVVNDPLTIAEAVSDAGPEPEVASPSQGSRLVPWAVIEGTVRYYGGGKLAADYRKIPERRGKNKGTMAIARKVLTLVYALRDGKIRCLAKAT